MEIVRGIQQIKVPTHHGMYTNAYLVEGQILIDTGWDTPEAFTALKEGVKNQRLSLKNVRHIIITHFHPDHFGLAGKISSLYGAQFALHQAEARLIDSRYVDYNDLVEKVKHLLHINGVPEGEIPPLGRASLPVRQFVDPSPPHTILSGGEVFSTGSFKLEVVPTPGHTPGHICLYEREQKLLFSGDHVLPDETPNVGLHPQSGENPLGDFFTSLRLLQNLQVQLVFPGHGVVFSGLALRIEQILQHHEARLAAIMHSLEEERKTAYQIATEIPWRADLGGTPFRELDPWNKRLAIFEALAHLQWLVTEGRVRRIPGMPVRFESINGA